MRVLKNFRPTLQGKRAKVSQVKENQGELGCRSSGGHRRGLGLGMARSHRLLGGGGVVGWRHGLSPTLPRPFSEVGVSIVRPPFTCEMQK